MILDQQAIRGLIPHRDAMCLLDTVEYWDSGRIVCRTAQHRSTANPLRRNDRLSSVSGVEFAAQAMAVHGRLLAPAEARPSIGLLVSLRDYVLHCVWIDDLHSALDIEAKRTMGNETVSIYDFTLRAGDNAVVEGRASVMLQRETLR